MQIIEHVTRTHPELSLASKAIIRDQAPIIAGTKTMSLPIQVHEVMIDKTGPGERTHELKPNETSLETRALLLAQGNVESVVAQMAINYEANAEIFRKLFPTRDNGYIDLRDPHFTGPALTDLFKKAMSGYASGRELELSAALYTIFVNDMFRGTAAIQITKPLVFTTASLDIFATPAILKEQVRIHSIMDVLDSANLHLNLTKITRLTPKYFVSEAARAMGNLGLALLDHKIHEQYFDDCQALVRYNLTPSMRETMLPADLRDNANLKILSSNLTFVLGSIFTPSAMKFQTAAHDLKNALAYVVAVLKKSPRLEITSVENIKKYVSHMQVKDAKEKVVGAVIWRNLNGAIRTQATRFIPMNSDETIHFQQPQRVVEEAFDAVGSSLFKKMSNHSTARLAHEILSNMAHAEEKPYGFVIGMGATDMLHYGVSVAKNIFLRHGEENQIAPATMLFEVEHKDHYLGSVGTYGERSLLRTPMEAIVLSEDNVQNVEVLPRVQGIKEESRNDFFWGDPNDLGEELTKTLNYKVNLNGTAVNLKVTLHELMGIHRTNEVIVTTPIVSRAVMMAYVNTVRVLEGLINNLTKKQKGLINQDALKTIIGMNVHSHLSSIYGSAAGKALSTAVVYKMLETLQPSQLEDFKINMYRSEKQIDLKVWTALVALYKMGLLEEYKRDLGYLRTMLTNARMIHFLVASSEFDFSEI